MTEKITEVHTAVDINSRMQEDSLLSNRTVHAHDEEEKINHEIQSINYEEVIEDTIQTSLLSKTENNMEPIITKRIEEVSSLFALPVSLSELERLVRNYNLEGAMWVFIWFTLNLGIAFANKMVFWGGFKYPVLLSLCHMLCSWVMAHFFIQHYIKKAKEQGETTEGKFEISPEVKSQLWIYIFVFILNIIFGNISVFRTSLHMSQIVRSTVPIFVLVLSYFLLNTIPSTWTILIVLKVIVGVILTVLNNVEVTFKDLIVLLTGNLFAALKTTLTNKQLKNHKIHPLVLIKYVSPFACVGMLIIAIFNGEVYSYYQNHKEVELIKGYGLVLGTSVASFFLNLTNFTANQKTSPLTMSLTANLKQVLLVLVSLAMFGESTVSFINVCGVVLTLGGMFIYSIHSL